MQSHACDVAVIGGGLAGASAALAFAQQGCSVRLFERRDLSRDPNRGDILHPPTVAIVRRLGVLDLLKARGATGLRGTEVVSRDGPLAVQGHDADHEYVILNHSEMETILVEAAASHGVVVQPDAVRSLVKEGPDGDLTGWLLTTAASSTRARFVVGADGAGSLTRRTLGIEYADEHEYDHWIVVLHATCPAWLEDERGWTLYHPDGAVFILPTTPVGRIRVVILVRKEEASAWMALSEADLAKRLSERHPKLGSLELTKRGGSHVYRLKRTHAASYSGPCAALVGDAIHTTHTWGGQGLNMAIQDSAKLAELVGPVLRDPAATEKALSDALVAYEANRRPINATVLERAHWGAGMAQPGEEAYASAVEFYEKAAADPNFLRELSKRFGGRQ